MGGAACAAARPTDNPVMLRINLGAGHAGAPGRFDRLREVALTYAFAIAATREGGWRGG